MMKRTAYLLPLLSLFFLPQVAGAEVISLSLPVTGSPEQAARSALLAHAEKLGAAGATVALARQSTVPRGAVYHYVQTVGGLPLLGQEVAVLLQQGRVVAITGALKRVTAVRRAAEVRDLAAARAVLQRQVAGAVVRGAERALLALPAAAGQDTTAVEVWELDVMTARPFGLWRAVVDASSGKLLFGLSALQHASGKVYSTNPKVGALTQVKLQGLATSGTELQGEFASVQSCSLKNGYQAECQRLAKPNAQGDFVYDPDEPSVEDPFAEVQAYYHTDAIHRWMKDTFGFSRRSNQKIDVMVNLHVLNSAGQPQGYGNAFFGDLNGDKAGDLVFGQSSLDFAYDADVVYHEFTHSAVNETSNLTIDLDGLGFNATPMALNEGFADLFSSMLAGDPVVGDYMKSTGIRKISGAASCPGSLTGESHADGLIWSRAVWTVRATLKDTTDYDEALYTTMTSLSRTAGFTDAQALFSKLLYARDQALSAAVDAEFQKRAYDQCTRILELKEGETRVAYIYGTRTTMGLNAVPGPFQYKIAVGEDVEELVISVRGASSYYGSAVGAYVRKDSPVAYSYQGSNYDFVKGSQDQTVTLRVGDGKNPLTPGAEYYVLAMNTSQNTGAYRISFATKQKQPLPPDMGAPEPDLTPPLEPDTGAPARQDAGVQNPIDPSDPASRGCSCSVGRPADGAGVGALLLLLGLGLVLRRRRR